MAADSVAFQEVDVEVANRALLLSGLDLGQCSIFRFDKEAGCLRLDTIHAPYTLDDIRENTGFDLGVTGPVATTPPPSAEELRALRTVVRPQMIETGTYGTWAEKTLGVV